MRRSVDIDSFRHRNPIPAACRKGPFLISGGIHGYDPATGELADGCEAQIALVFDHVRALVKAGGGSTEDIIKMTFWLTDRDNRALVNPHWLQMFPDPASRPVRHTMRGNLDGQMKVQCDFLAVVDCTNDESNGDRE
jgi:2-iminobutanoate/2-iminopropanoate deaminase